MGGGIVCQDYKESYRDTVSQDDEKCTFLVCAIQFAEHGSANYVRKERTRIRNLQVPTRYHTAGRVPSRRSSRESGAIGLELR